MNRRFSTAFLLLALGSCGLTQKVHAQTIPESNGNGFDTHLFRPALDSKGFFTVNGTDILGAGQVSFGFVIDYGHVLLRVADVGQRSPQLINHSFQGTGLFNYGLANRLVVGASTGINLMAGNAQTTPSGGAGVAGWGLGQLDSQTIGYFAIHSKYRVLRLENGLGVALAFQLGLPITNAPRSAGADPGLFYWPQLMVEKRFGGVNGDLVKLAINGGFRGHVVSDTALLLRNGQFRDGNRVTYGGGFSVRVLEPLDLVAETYGTALLAKNVDSGPRFSNELVGGLKVFVEKNSYLMLAGGPRYTGGFEAADIRATIGFIFEPSIGDRDNDGIKDDVDKCPDEPEDKDGFEDEDGCPDPDNDKDGIPDIVDRCPNVPEDFDGDRDTDGCPEFTDGDRDKDGIPDSKDKCPDEPEDYNGFEDDDGCPDGNRDRDKDGIPDIRDKCPDEPETYNGFEDDDGCPDQTKLIIKNNSIVILEKIQFATGSAVILPPSFSLLDAVADTLNKHPEFVLVEVAGHADERDSDANNLRLTHNRASSVVKSLVQRKVDSKRLRSKGYGEYCPEDPAHTQEAWEKNRRVEFKIVKNKDGPTGVELGCPNATAKGVKPDPGE